MRGSSKFGLRQVPKSKELLWFTHVSLPISARSSAGESDGFLIQERVFGSFYTRLRTVADARRLGHFDSRRLAQNCSVLRRKCCRP